MTTERAPTFEIRPCIDVPDLERAIAFYTEGLGLRVGRRPGDTVVELLGADSPIDLLLKPAGTPACYEGPHRRDYRRHWTPVHLDFVVADLEQAIGRAEAAGASLDRPIQDNDGGRMANMADPFGHGFCLLEFKGEGSGE